MTDKSKELEVSEKKTIERAHGEPTREGLMYVPNVDIVEDAEMITLRADLPGVRKEQVDIDVREGVLTLNAPVDPIEQDWQPVYTEYRQGGFARRFTLGEQIDTDKINAKVENGVLTLQLPKAEQHKPRKIKIG